MSERWRRGDYVVDTDPGRLDVDAIHGFLTEAYWCRGIPRETVGRSLAGSLNFGLYHGGEDLAGFGRVVSDRATFAWIGDVFVLPEHRGRGLGVWLVACMLAPPELQGLRRWILATDDAHGLYRRFGFTELADPGAFLTKHDPDAYRPDPTGG